MKLLKYFPAICFLLFATTLSAYAGGGCGNKGKKGPSPECCCCETNPTSCPVPCPATPNLFDPFTGNASRKILDLEVWGGVGEIPLAFMRYGHSRYSAFPRPFGLAHHWNHSFHYTMYDDGVDEQGRARVVIHFPQGDEYVFTQDAASPGLWLPLPGIDNRLFQEGNNFFLQMANGHRYRFEKLTDPSGGVWPYENNTNIYYQLQDIRDSHQNLYTLTYDNEHWLTRVTEPAGRYLQITYGTVNGWRVITHVGTSDGRSVQYRYDLFHDEVHSWIRDWVRLIGVDYGDGTHAQYEYWQSEPGKGPNLEHAIDPRYTGPGVNMRYTYNTAITEGYIREEKNGISGEVMATLTPAPGYRLVCYPNGRVQKYVLPDELLGNTITYTDGLGRSTKYAYGEGGLGFADTITDALGRVTIYARTIYGNPLEITYPDKSMEKWARDDLDLIVKHTDELGRETVFTRDGNHRITKIEYPDKTFEMFTYNDFGQVLSHTRRNGGVEYTAYDSRGLKIAFQDALGNVTRYTFDVADRLASVEDALHRTTGYNYNERGLLTQTTNADASFQLYGYDEFGNREIITDELRHTWSTAYDEFRRPKTKTDPLNRVTLFRYDVNGICGCSFSDFKPTQIILPGGMITKIDYDVEWEKVKETIGSGTPYAASTAYEYDLEGNLTTLISPRGEDWSYAYDLRDKLINIVDPLLNKTEINYDLKGNVLSEKRPDNAITKNTYDSMDRQIETIDPKGQRTKMVYDAEDNLTELTDANGHRYNYQYDLLERRTRMIFPDNSMEGYGYNAVNNLLSDTNRAGIIRNLNYDNRNREVSSIWNDNLTPAIFSSYDIASRLLTKASNASTLNYTYNEANELLGETQDIAGAPNMKAIKYEYNDDGLRKTLAYPDGSLIHYTYTGRNQTASITEDGLTLAGYAYDLNGNRVTKDLKNGTSTAYTYDAVNRLLMVDNKKGANSFARFNYGYDNVDRRTFVKRDNAKGDVFVYDSVDQITSVQYDVTEPDGLAANALQTVNYTYDQVGNREAVISNGTAVNYATNILNQYTGVGDSSLFYNNNGDLQDFNGWRYTYDAQNRLIKAEKEEKIVEFAYDPRNRRIKQTVNGVTTFFYYDNWTLLEERNSNDALLNKYVHGAKVDEILSKTSSTEGTVYYHFDALGSTVRLTNSTGDVVEQYTYEVFGAVTINNNIGQTLLASSFNNRFMFTGRELVNEINLYDYRNRMYSTELGRFLQTDPLELFAGDVNLYRYVNNNIVNWRDPWGLQIQLDDTFSDQEKDAINSLLETIKESSPEGKQLVEHAIETHLTIKKDPYTNCPYYEDNTIYFNLNVKIKVLGPSKKEKGYLAWTDTPPVIILAHELGHNMGTKDDGPDNFNNVKKWENPVRKGLGLSERTYYKHKSLNTNANNKKCPCPKM